LVKPGHLEAKWGKIFDRSFENRQAADYLVFAIFETDQVEQLIQDAEGFVQAMRQLLPD